MAWFFKFSQTVAWWCHLGSNACKLHNGISRYLRAKASGCNVVLKLLMQIPIWKAHWWTVCPRIITIITLAWSFAVVLFVHVKLLISSYIISLLCPHLYISNISPKGTPKEVSMSRQITRTRPGCEHPLQVHQPKSPGHRVRGQKSLRPRL